MGWNINTSVLGPTCLHTLYYGNLVYCFNNEVGSQNESFIESDGKNSAALKPFLYVRVRRREAELPFEPVTRNLEN